MNKASGPPLFSLLIYTVDEIAIACTHTEIIVKAVDADSSRRTACMNPRWFVCDLGVKQSQRLENGGMSEWWCSTCSSEARVVDAWFPNQDTGAALLGGSKKHS